VPVSFIDNGGSNGDTNVNTSLEEDPEESNTQGSLVDKVQVGNDGKSKTFKSTLTDAGEHSSSEKRLITTCSSGPCVSSNKSRHGEDKNRSLSPDVSEGGEKVGGDCNDEGHVG